jgi:hypothetical protein
MNMAFSVVAGSRPARGCSLADGDGKGTIKAGSGVFNLSPPFAGRGRIALAIRVRGRAHIQRALAS